MKFNRSKAWKYALQAMYAEHKVAEIIDGGKEVGDAYLDNHTDNFAKAEVLLRVLEVVDMKHMGLFSKLVFWKTAQARRQLQLIAIASFFDAETASEAEYQVLLGKETYQTIKSIQDDYVKDKL